MSQEEIQQAQQLAVWVAGVVFGVNALLALVWGVRRLALSKPTFAPTWSLVDVWGGAQIALLLTFLLAGLLMGVVLVVGFSLPAVRLPRDEVGLLFLWALPATILQNACFFAVPAAFIVWKYGQRLRDIGLPARPRAQDWWAGIVLGLVLVVVFALLEEALGAAAQQLRHIRWVERALEYEKANPVAEIIRALPRQGYPTLALAVLSIGVSAPLGEEMLFRGFLFNALKRRFGLAVGLVLSALLFAAVHTYAIGLLPVFLIGLILAWVYHNGGSLWTSILIHAVNNTAAVLIAYFFPSAAR
jgi:membrane protease YdiL (CAAX protease family)